MPQRQQQHQEQQQQQQQQQQHPPHHHHQQHQYAHPKQVIGGSGGGPAAASHYYRSNRPSSPASSLTSHLRQHHLQQQQQHPHHSHSHSSLQHHPHQHQLPSHSPSSGMEGAGGNHDGDDDNDEDDLGEHDDGGSSQIIDVYADTLENELVAIRDAIEIYPYVAFDSEFPGVVARPIGHFKSTSDYHYQTLRSNVDLLRIIQLGITLSDENGNLAQPISTWQFNFKFSLEEDMYAPESIELLTNSGINFKKHQEYGIDVEAFGELLISSGLVLFDDVKWISFHSGYDFGYLLKLVSCAPLPPTETEFFELLKIWFPCIYDIKFLMRSCKSLKGGLQDVADELQVARIGPQHQAGSDSLLTSATFFKMRSRYFEDEIDPKYLGNLYGLGTSSTLFHQTQGSGSGSGGGGGGGIGASSTPQLQSALPTPGGMAALAGPPIPPVASAALPIKDPFGASPFKLQSVGNLVTTPGGSLADLPHASSPSPGSGLRGL